MCTKHLTFLPDTFWATNKDHHTDDVADVALRTTRKLLPIKHDHIIYIYLCCTSLRSQCKTPEDIEIVILCAHLQMNEWGRFGKTQSGEIWFLGMMVIWAVGFLELRLISKRGTDDGRIQDVINVNKYLHLIHILQHRPCYYKAFWYDSSQNDYFN